MPSLSLKRHPRIAFSLLAAAAATIAAGALGASPAFAAAPKASLAITPGSGADFTTNAASVSWSLTKACVGQEVDVFLYQGTGAWNSAAINTAEGNNGGQQTYYNFVSNADATAATGSASWPNVASGYQLFGAGSGAVFASTDALVSALGSGLYTMSIACVNNTTFAPILNHGHPVAASRVVVLGATGNSWQLSAAAGTQVALKGHGSARTQRKVTLKAAVTASDGTVPAGAVNFYAGGSATGTPLNGSKPVQLNKNGKAIFAGDSGYPAGVQGSQAYTVQFVPAAPASYTPSSVTGNINLIGETVRINVTAKPDPNSATSVDLTATAVGKPVKLATLLPGGGVNFIVDGNVVAKLGSSFPGPFAFNSSGVATDTITGLAPDSHVFSAQLADSNDDVLDPAVGDKVIVNSATVQITG